MNGRAAETTGAADADELAPQPVSFYAAVFFLVNLTYCALIWELVEAKPTDAAAMRVRRVMRRRSLVTLALFGAAAEVALWLLRPLICIGCLIVCLRPGA
jgi:uncharacterized membrane protein